MAITSIDQLVAAWSTSANRQDTIFVVTDKAESGGGYAQSVDSWTDFWRVDCYNGKGAGAIPTTVEAPTSATLGAIPYRDAATGINYLTKFRFFGHYTYSMCAMLYDRLLHIGGLDATVTSAQTVAGVITRNTGGVGNQIWIEQWATIGTTNTTITASYTNSDGTSGRTTQATVIGDRNGDYLSFKLPLQDDDEGVQSVESVTVLATTGTAGNFGVCIAHPLGFEMSYRADTLGVYTTAGMDGTDDGMGPIALEDGACLAIKNYQAAATEYWHTVSMNIVEVI